MCWCVVGGVLYFVAGKALPFLALALIALLDGALLLIVMKPVRQARAELATELPVGTPIWRLILDPFVAVCAGCLVMANVSLAFLEPTLAKWMRDEIGSSEVETGLVWFLAFFPHVAGVIFTVKIAECRPAIQWALAAGGLALEGVSCLVIPMCTGLFSLMLPICALCFGIALVDTALLPTLGYIVDTRHTSVYGSVYAIAGESQHFLSLFRSYYDIYLLLCVNLFRSELLARIRYRTLRCRRDRVDD